MVLVGHSNGTYFFGGKAKGPLDLDSGLVGWSNFTVSTEVLNFFQLFAKVRTTSNHTCLTIKPFFIT